MTTSGNAGPFRRLLVAFDGSADSAAALRTATAIVSDGQGHVVALAVLAGASHREARQDDHAQNSDEARRIGAAFDAIRAAITQSSPVRMDLHTVQARQVAEALSGYAAEHGFDLLVIGRHGGGTLIHPRLGHVAEAVARTCQVPVLLVSAT
ncbi:MAG TPA: universal stress protein [Streptosporangiaceae bacterium]|nr:universal stress protein [Streptosporangiaceae bacterium]